ncbi:hypothetical protein M426DRAFT_27372 [Hypoxylon sp. CI-4A]|nr:hypothetical protein M426DRAFT_27372 [Hypoxylon sp. CI-4A]
MAARLKALGVESVAIHRNAQIGDNWAHRYDCLKFHVPTSNYEMPYVYYAKELRSLHRLTKHDVVEHLRQYAADLHLNVILSTTIYSTSYNTTTKKWTIRLKAASGGQEKTVVSKHFVQATGIGSQKPYLPALKYEESFRSTILHSAHFGNAQSVAKKGIKSVAVIGSANTAFDIIEHCHDAGLETTMVARSPTYVFPYEYAIDPHGIGAYGNMPLEVADRLLNAFPLALDGQFSHGLFSHLASREPDRYQALVEAGVCLSDGSIIDVDAIIWCTGFAGKDIRETASDVLGVNESDPMNVPNVIGPKDIAARLDAS